MKHHGPREQGNKRTRSVGQLLRQALPPIGDQTDSPRDLWPAVERGLHAHTAPNPALLQVPWFDWALGCGLTALLVLFPAWIPVLLYCL